MKSRCRRQRAAAGRSRKPCSPSRRDAEAYWQSIRDQQIADGLATNYDKSTIAKGGAVKIRNGWMKVKRANAKTVTVESGCGFDLKYTYAEIKDYKAPEV
jgi:hypothetical protein